MSVSKKLFGVGKIIHLVKPNQTEQGLIARFDLRTQNS